MRKKSLCLSLCISILFGFTAFAGQGIKDYEGHWAQNAIEGLIGTGVISGDETGAIRPDDNITRGEFVRVINGFFGYTKQAETGFSDVGSDKWYYREFLIAKNAGYIAGDNEGKANPEQAITRAEVCVILERILPLGTGSSGVSFRDEEDFPSWAHSAIQALSVRNIINGYNDSTFRANNQITRGEAFSLLSRVETKIEPVSAGVQTGNQISMPVGSVSSGGSSGSGSSLGATGGQSTQLQAPSVIRYEDGKIKFKKISNAASYEIKIAAVGYPDKVITIVNNKSEYEFDISSDIEAFCSQTTETEITLLISIRTVAVSGYQSSQFEQITASKITFIALDSPSLNLAPQYDAAGDFLCVSWEPVEHAVSYEGFLMVNGQNTSAGIVLNQESLTATITDLSVVRNKNTSFFLKAVSGEKDRYRDSALSEIKISNEKYLGGGTPENPYIIETESEFYSMEELDASYVITKDLTLNTPIASFSGTLTGKKNGIEGEIPVLTLDITENDEHSVALIRSMPKGSVHNLKTAGSVTSSGTGGDFAAALVGKAAGDIVLIENCVNEANVTKSATHSGAEFGTGGIAGGGFIRLINCVNSATIQSTKSEFVGGIAGFTKESVSDCENTGNITGLSNTGGIIGRLSGGMGEPVERNVNRGSIKGSGSTGGIVGSLTVNTSSLKYNKNYGAVTGGVYTGGIVGLGAQHEIEYCANFGDVTATSEGGGISGRSLGNIKCSYNMGKIRATASPGRSGGITGGVRMGNISDCYNLGEIEGLEPAGLANYTAYAISSTISNSYHAGKINRSDGAELLYSVASGVNQPTVKIENTYFLSEDEEHFAGTNVLVVSFDELSELDLGEAWNKGDKESEFFCFPTLKELPQELKYIILK